MPKTQTVPNICLLYLAIILGKYMSKFSLCSLVYLVARGVRGQVHLLKIKTRVSKVISPKASQSKRLKVLLMPQYKT